MAGMMMIRDDRGTTRIIEDGSQGNKSDRVIPGKEFSFLREVAGASSVRAACDIILRGIGNVQVGAAGPFETAVNELKTNVYRQITMWGMAFVIDVVFEGEHVPRIFMPLDGVDEVVCIRNEHSGQIVVVVKTDGALRKDILVLVHEMPTFAEMPKLNSPCAVLGPHYNMMVRSYNDLRALSAYLASTPLVLVGKPAEAMKTHDNAIQRASMSLYDSSTSGLFNGQPGALYGDEVLGPEKESEVKASDAAGLPVTTVAIGGILRPVVKIPDGQTPAAIPAPSHGLKADEVASTFGTEVAAVWGIPSHLIIRTKLQRVTNASEDLDQVIAGITNMLTLLLQRVCDVIYPEKKIDVHIEYSHRLTFPQLLQLGQIADPRDVLKIIEQRYGDHFRPAKEAEPKRKAEAEPARRRTKKPRYDDSDSS